MTVIRYEPGSLFNQLQNEINRLFESRVGPAGEDSSTVVTSHWMPAVDIREETDRFVLYADVPGVDPKDIEVTMENGVLTIRGERKLESEEEREGYKRTERARGTFYRRFSLPDSADPERVSARGKNGVLEVTIPKHERVQPRKISVAE
ncbi:MAG: Hsp20/alpha crystallin family protein [Gammaproteobacteria bacterium]|nr:Hsp20/alpha crystallin family protein [Gammaproteobacteria bacterium]